MLNKKGGGVGAGAGACSCACAGSSGSHIMIIIISRALSPPKEADATAYAALFVGWRPLHASKAPNLASAAMRQIGWR